MGTRSTIALEFADGTVKQIYCHWDGYLSHNGAILQENYMDPFKVKQLVEMGGLSSLGKEIGERMDFDMPTNSDQCKFYARDRGEELRVNEYENLSDYYQHCQEEEFDYILRNINGVATWFVRCDVTNATWVTIPKALALETEKFGEEA